MKIVLGLKIRPARVVILTQRVIFLAGAIFIFNITLVPVVLLAFHNMALYALLICIFAALLYFLRVNDKKEAEKGTYNNFSSKSSDDDIF